MVVDSAETERFEGSGAAVLVEQLGRAGLRRIFCVPGESYLAALDQLWHHQREIDTVPCRHEAGAALMANAHGKLTGDIAAAFVTRGPGATNAAIGVHTASQDGVAFLLLIGQVPRPHEDRHSFQELDYQSVFGGMAKEVIEVRAADRMAERVSHGIHVARSGRPGPVVIVLPEDVLSEVTTVGPTRLASRPRLFPDPQQVDNAVAVLAGARAPMIIVGGPCWDVKSSEGLRDFAERHAIPVAAGYRRQDCFDNRSSCYVGVLGSRVTVELRSAVANSDVIVAIGSRLGRITTGGYKLVCPPAPTQALVHIVDDPRDLGRVFEARVGIVSNPGPLVEALNSAELPSERWRARTASLRSSHLADLNSTVAEPDEVDMTAVMAEIRTHLDERAVVTIGAGNFTYWCSGFYQFPRYGTQLGTTSGAMGYAIPAAVAAKLHDPDRPVVAFSGDGDFLMTGQELATAAQHAIEGLVVIVANNSGFGTIRAHQERRFPGHVIGTELQNPDFVDLARAYGAEGVRVTKTSQFASVFRQALDAKTTTLIELVVPSDIVSPDERLTDLYPMPDLSPQ